MSPADSTTTTSGFSFRYTQACAAKEVKASLKTIAKNQADKQQLSKSLNFRKR
jgi:hypothetical protein